MTGKIFAESSNIYDDEAKVLFDYYKKAAEKIVSEETDLENKLQQAKDALNKAEKKKKVSFILMIALCWTIVGLIAGLISYLKAKKSIEEETAHIQGYTEAYGAVRKDYKVSKLGVAYVPVATRVPFEGKSFVVDYTGAMQNTDFSLTVLHHPEELQKSLSELEEGIREVPVVEGNENAEQVDTSDYSLSMQSVTVHDYMGNIDRQVRNISYLLGDNDTRSVSLPVVPPESETDAFISSYATTDTNGKPVVPVFSIEGFSDKLESFSKLSDMKKELEANVKENEDNSEYFKRLMKSLGETVQVVSKVKTNSTSKLLDYTNSILSAVLKAGYNQYSPVLEAEEIQRIRESNFDYQESVDSYKPFSLKQSSRVKYDLFGASWVSEDNRRTVMPFGMNQVEEEVLMPVINNLMNETRVKRLDIYNNIKDQKLQYLNKWHQDVEAAFRDNRKTGQELLNQITNAYAEYNTAYQTYNSYKETQDSLKSSGNLENGEVKEKDNTEEMVAGFTAQAAQCTQVSDQFQDYMDRLQDDINLKAEKFGHIEYYEASLRDSESRDIARSQTPENLQSLEDRRKKLIPVSSYYATYAEIPPCPKVEPKLLDDFTLDLKRIAEHHLDELNRHSAEMQKPDLSETAESSESPVTEGND